MADRFAADLPFAEHELRSAGLRLRMLGARLRRQRDDADKRTPLRLGDVTLPRSQNGEGVEGRRDRGVVWGE